MYCNQSNIEKRYGLPELIELTDRSGAGEVDVESVAEAIESAASVIDSYLLVRYQLPLASVPMVLRNYAIDIAIYTLFNLRRMGDIDDVRIRYEDAIKWLERVRDYKAEVVGGVAVEATPAPPAAAGGYHRAQASDSSFDWGRF